MPEEADRMRLVKRMVEELHALGVRPAGVLLVHSSLKALGYVPGGPATVIEALLAALGPDCTLLMPALSYQYVTRARPLFDLRHTPSNVGVIAETFRRRGDVTRSVHPTHSVCATGPQSAALLRDHELDNTPCGPNSPFRRLPAYNGQILMLGCGLHPNTSLHAIEEVIVPPYLFGTPLIYQIVLADGTRRAKEYITHGFAGWRQRYDRVGELMEPPQLKSGRVLAATAHLMDTAALWDAALAALRRDPYYFVDQFPT
ncbi:MAG: AAC(3) family N-acetyltransferase [Caldilineaceae bacterium]|nr:AAC(3) family N-acetyltransferase [Caldilineaceae bacterium]